MRIWTGSIIVAWTDIITAIVVIVVIVVVTAVIVVYAGVGEEIVIWIVE